MSDTTTATRERPIIMQAHSVAAIIAGRKTQTRRVVKPQPWPLKHGDIMGSYDGDWAWSYDRGYSASFCVSCKPNGPDGWAEEQCPYGRAGDRLWVKESWRACSGWDATRVGDIFADAEIRYEADEWVRAGVGDGCWGKLRNPLFMPRKLCRLTLEITAVRVERVQDISDTDIQAEGSFEANQHMLSTQRRIEKNCRLRMHAHRTKGVPLNDSNESRRADFAILWDALNAARGFPWSANPWVWCISFQRVRP